jgi:hypothetical protein
VQRRFFGSLDPQPHFVAPNIDHGDDEIVTDDKAFVLLPRKDEYGSTSGSWNLSLDLDLDNGDDDVVTDNKTRALLWGNDVDWFLFCQQNRRG